MKKWFLFTLVCTMQLSFAQYSMAQPAIAVQTSGTGRDLMFLPGFTVPGSVWDETIANLPGSFRTHVVSYAGFDGMPAIEMPWYETLKEELLAYLDANSISQLTIVGHSMGGTLALDIAVERPGIVDRLVLVDALPNMLAVLMPGVPSSVIQYASPYNDQMLAMNEEQFVSMAQAQSQGMTLTAENQARVTDWILAADRKTYVYGYTDLLKLDLQESLGSVSAQALILGTSFPDRDTVLATFENQYANLANKQIVLAENARHFIMLDEPQWFFEQLNAFLNGLQ